MTRRRRVLYLMHVDWRWIKQRPHFLAEALAATHDVTVMFKPHPRRFLLPRNAATTPHWPLLPLPSKWRVPRVLMWIQRLLVRLVARRTRAEVCWITHPGLAVALPRPGTPLVYDCMDDALAMARSPEERARLASLERDLIGSASLVITTSGELQRRLAERYGVAAHLVRNGLTQSMADRPAPSPLPWSGRPRAVYVGTLGPWLDFSALLQLAEADFVDIDLVGPVAVSFRIDERLRTPGPIPHSDVPATLARADVLMMPFELDETVAAVDPVKLYEYVASGRPTVARYYEELEQFRPFVQFYDAAEGFVESVRAALSTPQDPATAAAREQFLAEATWERRCQQIIRLVTNLS